MTDYPDYNKATNAAYETLQQYSSSFPKIDIFRIVMSYPNVKVHTYSYLAQRMGLSVHKFTRDIASSEHGFTVCDNLKQRWEVFYNETKCERTIRSTLAHELGHIVLKHTKDGNASIEDREANCFARNLLCPVPIRKELGLTSLSDYCNAFDISERMAQVAIDLNSSDTYYITQQNYNGVNDKVYCYFSGYTLEELYGYGHGYEYGY